MSTIDIKDMHEQESELFIEDLGKIRGGSLQGNTTSAASHEEDPYFFLPADLKAQIYDAHKLTSDLLSDLPEYNGGPGGATTLALFGEE